MRCTLGSCAASRMTARWPGVKTLRIDVEPVGAHHHDRRHLLALVARQLPVRHRRQPDVGVEPDLVAGVPGEHRTAARLRHVADQDPGPAGILVGLGRQPLQQRDHVGMRPVAIARQPHHLPGVAGDRQRFARPRCSPWRRSRSRASASPRAAPCGRTTPWRRVLGSLGLASGGSGFGSTLPLSCASATVAPARATAIRSGMKNQAGLHRITLCGASVARIPKSEIRRRSQLLDFPHWSLARGRPAASVACRSVALASRVQRTTPHADRKFRTGSSATGRQFNRSHNPVDH